MKLLLLLLISFSIYAQNKKFDYVFGLKSAMFQASGIQHSGTTKKNGKGKKCEFSYSPFYDEKSASGYSFDLRVEGYKNGDGSDSKSIVSRGFDIFGSIRPNDVTYDVSRSAWSGNNIITIGWLGGQRSSENDSKWELSINPKINKLVKVHAQRESLLGGKYITVDLTCYVKYYKPYTYEQKEKDSYSELE